MRHAAVVVNPTKVGDLGALHKLICTAMSSHGWGDPLWLETTADETGAAQAKTALAAGVELVIACGGDGTVTACVAAVAGTSVPLAILPAGTGNLLARNLRLPLDLGEALVVALTGTDSLLDVGRANEAPFVVMAGLGLDARMLDSASDELKKRAGWLAYAWSLARQLRHRPVRARLRVDGGPAVRRRASAIIVGNVGTLRAGIPLLPDAKPDDGMLDVVVLTAQGWAAWATVAAHLMLRRRTTNRVTRMTCRELRIDVDREQLWQADGEVLGRTKNLVVTIAPGRLLLRVPAE